MGIVWAYVAITPFMITVCTLHSTKKKKKRGKSMLTKTVRDRCSLPRKRPDCKGHYEEGEKGESEIGDIESKPKPDPDPGQSGC